MAKEKIYYGTFTTKKCLIHNMLKTHINKHDDNGIMKNMLCIQIGYSKNLNESSTFSFLFENETVVNEAYKELISYINICKDTDFINFDGIINEIKEKYNQSLLNK